MELLTNPFFMLGATTRDDRHRIFELAEEKSLVSDDVAVRDAKLLLTHPRQRLSAELGWLPGLGPKRVLELISILQGDSVKLQSLRNLPVLARSNLLADGLIQVVGHLSTREIAQWIIDLANAYDEINSEELITLLNEERLVADFPVISDLQIVDAELQSRREYFRQAITRALDRLPTRSLVDVVTVTVEVVTENGNKHAPILVYDMVDNFEAAAQGFFDIESNNITDLVEKVRSTLNGDYEIDPLITRLEEVVKNWDYVAQPIQVSSRSLGTNHSISYEVAGVVRSLAVDLFNQHGRLEISKRLTELIQEVFAEVDRVVEQSEEDATQLNEIAERRSEILIEMQSRAENWKKEVTYEAEVGVIFKEQLRISPDGIEWRGSIFPLEEITRVRWGGTKHSISGIPTDTTYSIFVGNEKDGAIIDLRKQQVYSEFVNRLWKTVGVRLLTEMLERLRSGESYKFGAAVVTDYGVELERRQLFSANERIPCKWRELVIGNRDGTFYIAKNGEKNVGVELAYQYIDNVHILEIAMRAFWKNVSHRLSDLLDKVD